MPEPLHTAVRVATPDDAPALLALYAPYVRDTAITFEYEVPSVEEFRARIEGVLARYPYLVAERDGAPVGYAYAGPFKERAAYDWAVETSLYVARGLTRTGVGGALHAALESCLRAQGILNMEACIAVPSRPDHYLTRNSVEFHEHLGYRMVGEFKKCGCKFGRWYDMAWMELEIGHHGENSQPPMAFSQVRKTVQERYGIVSLAREQADR